MKNLVRISFYELLKTINMINLVILGEKAFFLQVWLNKFLWSKIWECVFKRIKNTLIRNFLDFWPLNIFFYQTWRKEKNILLFQDFWGKHNFLEHAFCHRKMVGVTIFGRDIGFCIVNLMISIKKHLTNFFRISCYELLKVTTVLITYMF